MERSFVTLKINNFFLLFRRALFKKGERKNLEVEVVVVVVSG